MSGWTVAWLMWVAYFFAVEGPALRRANYGGTLTRHIRWWFGFEGKPRGWRIRRAVWAGFLVWLFLHTILPEGSF